MKTKHRYNVTVILEYLSVLGQKSESQNQGNKKAKHAKFSKNEHFLPPWYAHVRVRIRG